MKYLLLFLITLTPSYSQIINGDFEEWTNIDDHGNQEEIEALGVLDAKSGNLENWFVSGGQAGCIISNESVSGDHALILHNWYGYAEGWAEFNGDIDFIPKSISGYYKYQKEESINDDNTSAYINVVLSSFTIDTIAYLKYYLPESEDFQYFNIPIDDIRSNSPVENISFRIQNAEELFCTDFRNICQLLFVDNIQLETTTSIDDDNDFSVYPNPFIDQLSVDLEYIVPSTKYIEVLDIIGNVVQRQEIKNSSTHLSIKLNQLPRGTYLVKIGDKVEMIIKE